MDNKEQWRKASYSNGQGECIEVGHIPERIAVRDTKLPRTSPVLKFTPDAWRKFANRIKTDLVLRAGR